MYNIRITGLVGLAWWRVGGPYVEVKTVELASNFMTDMTRYQVIPPERSGRSMNECRKLGREVLSMWYAILHATKKEQMQLTGPGTWPTDKFLPWDIHELDTMPVVVWIKRRPDAGGLRS